MLKALCSLHHSQVFSCPEWYTSSQFFLSGTTALEPSQAKYGELLKYIRNRDLGIRPNNRGLKTPYRGVKYVHGFFLRCDPVTNMFSPVAVCPAGSQVPQIVRVALQRDASGLCLSYVSLNITFIYFSDSGCQHTNVFQQCDSWMWKAVLGQMGPHFT